jgi:tripartite-type tricarboxylate transporter receptor subunit TctC
MYRLASSLVLAGALAAAPGTLVAAQDYPSKPVTFVTLAAAGNSPDVITRLVADRLTQLWKQQVVVINRPGAGGLIAAQAAAGLPNDGCDVEGLRVADASIMPTIVGGHTQAAAVMIGEKAAEMIAADANA